MSYINQTKIETSDTPIVDAFGRLRVSEPFTLFDSKQLHDNLPLFWDQSLSGGTATYVAADATTQMSVAAAGQYVIRQTKRRFNYEPGKSQLSFFTFYAPSDANTVKRVGLFDGTGVNNLTPNNGIYFQNSGGTLSWNIAKNGTVTETVAQASWNVDTLDGLGRTGITLDPAAVQIAVVDYEWLGVGRVRVGFVIDGVIYPCHQFLHSNDPSFTSVYMTTPNLPLRYDITSSGGTGRLDHICSTVLTEGGTNTVGIIRSISTENTALSAPVAGTVYALLGIRLKSTHLDMTVLPQYLNLLSTSNDYFRWMVCINPTVDGVFTYGNLTNSCVQYAIGAATNTISNTGTILCQGYQVDNSSFSYDVNNALKIGSTINGTADQLVVGIMPLSPGLTIHGAFAWKEL